MAIEVTRTVIVTAEEVVVVARVPANVNDVTAESIADKICKEVRGLKEAHYAKVCRDDYDVRNALETRLRNANFSIVATR
jgi:hypothetical protein